MSAPRVIAEMVVTGIRILGKATAAAGQQAVRNFKHKPEGAPSAGPVGTGSSSKSALSNQMQMSLEEAHLILNSKPQDAMENIIKNYERIFAANGPPPEPTPSTSASGSAQAAARRPKGPTHSHYLQSKVYRALERIKAERGEEGGSPGAGLEGAATAGQAANPAATAAAPGATGAPPPGS